jgi:hypothetical protein
VKCSPVSVRLRIIYHNIYVGSYTNQYLLRYCLEWFLDLFFGSCVKKCQHACGQAVCGWANQVVGTTLLRPRVCRSTISMEDPAPETLTLVPPSMASSALLRRLHAHDVDNIHRCSGWLPLSCCLCVLCFCYSMNKKLSIDIFWLYLDFPFIVYIHFLSFFPCQGLLDGMWQRALAAVRLLGWCTIVGDGAVHRRRLSTVVGKDY